MDETPKKGHPSRYSAEEISYLKLLYTLKNLDPSEHELGVVKGIALWNSSAAILTAISHVPKWGGNWEIREAVYQNPGTPKKLKDLYGRCIAVINLMYELDNRELPEKEKEEIREDIRYLIRMLSAVDREIVRARAKELAFLREELAKKKAEDEKLGRKAELERKARIERARSVSDLQEIRELLKDGEEKVRAAALDNPHLDESTIIQLAAEGTDEKVLKTIAGSMQWYFRDKVRKCLWKNPSCPPEIKTRLGDTIAIWKTFKQIEAKDIREGEARETAKKLMSSIQSLPKLEQEYLKSKIGPPAWSWFIGQVLMFIEEEVGPAAPASQEEAKDLIARFEVESREAPAQRAPAAPLPMEWLDREYAKVVDEETVSGLPYAEPAAAPEEEAAEGVEAEPAAEEDEEVHEGLLERPPEEVLAAAPVEREVETVPLPSAIPKAEGADRLALGEKIHTARETESEEEMGFLLHYPDVRVFEALLDNPHLPVSSVSNVARAFDMHKVERLYGSKKWFSEQLVKLALIHNPHTPMRISNEILTYIGNFKDLLAIVRDGKIQSFQVKTKARSKLIERYKAMATEEKIAAIKSTGGEILNHLWTDAFVDERVFMKMLKEEALEQNIVLKIARSRIAPRNILAEIGKHPKWTKNTTIAMELIQNPKTPREVAQKLITQLKPSEKKILRARKDIPESLRRYTGI
jgi:hypothetical protein